VCQEPVIWSRTQVALGVLPYLVLAAVVVIDVIVGHGIGLLALLSLGPAFAAVVGGLTRMIIVSCLALALCLFLAAYQDRLFDVDDQVALVTVLSGLHPAWGVPELTVRTGHNDGTDSLVAIRGQDAAGAR